MLCRRRAGASADAKTANSFGRCCRSRVAGRRRCCDGAGGRQGGGARSKQRAILWVATSGGKAQELVRLERAQGRGDGGVGEGAGQRVKKGKRRGVWSARPRRLAGGGVRGRGFPGPMKPYGAGEIEGEGGGKRAMGSPMQTGPALLAVKLPLPMKMGGNGRASPTPAYGEGVKRGHPCTCLS